MAVIGGAWADVPVGTIVDSDIEHIVAAGGLITHDFEPTAVRQACYELRASDTFYDLDIPDEDKRVVVDPVVGFVLRPHRSVISIVMEEIRLPNDVLARVLTKGQLFSIGVLPVNTYADPGFEGRLGITLWNASERYIVIRPTQRIAKIEFVRLARAVAHPYNGQHGYMTEIWPIPTHLYGNPTVLRDQGLIGDEGEEFKASYGGRLATLRSQVLRYSRKVWLQLAVTLLVFTVLFTLYGELSIVSSVTIGIVSNLLTTIGWNLISDRVGSR